MEVKLVVTGGKNAGRAVPVAGGKFFIGRAPDCHLRPRSDLISQHHCLVLVDKDAVSVRDFGSKTGTWVNGQRVERERGLKPGDRLRIGRLEFEVRIAADVDGQKKPKVETPPPRR